MTIILNLRSASGREAAKKIRQAAQIIKSGGVVVFPTETVYGIGANALDAKACKKIYSIKGRAKDNPLIVHVSSLKMALRIGEIPEKYAKILSRIWPAPLTVIVRAKNQLPKVVTGGLNTVAIRMPDSKIALELINQCGVPIAAPSANISKRPSSTSGSHAKKYFDGKVDAIIDSGSSRFGIESTVISLIDLSLLRPGAYTVKQVEKEFGKRVKITDEIRGTAKATGKPLSPGMKYRHYSPEKPLYLFTGDIAKLPSITTGADRFTFIGSNESCSMMHGHASDTISLGSRKRPSEIAHNLFGALISLDSKKSKFAIIENFSEVGIGLAIMNRIRKACSNKYFSCHKELHALIEG